MEGQRRDRTAHHDTIHQAELNHLLPEKHHLPNLKGVSSLRQIPEHGGENHNGKPDPEQDEEAAKVMIVAIRVKVRDAILVVDGREDALLVLGAYQPSRRGRGVDGGRGIGGYRGRSTTAKGSVGCRAKSTLAIPRESRRRLLEAALFADGLFAQRWLEEVDPGGFARSRGMVVGVPVVVEHVNRGGFSHLVRRRESACCGCGGCIVKED